MRSHTVLGVEGHPHLAVWCSCPNPSPASPKGQLGADSFSPTKEIPSLAIPGHLLEHKRHCILGTMTTKVLVTKRKSTGESDAR